MLAGSTLGVGKQQHIDGMWSPMLHSAHNNFNTVRAKGPWVEAIVTDTRFFIFTIWEPIADPTPTWSLVWF